MYSNYLFIGGCALTGGLIYNAIDNLLDKPGFYEKRSNIFNYGMLFGLSVGSGLAYFRNTEKLLIKSSE